VVVGIEIDRGLVVYSLLAAGYEVYAINPMASARYRDRHATSGAKSDPGDAKVLADLVRTDRHNHRPIAGDSDLAEGVKLLARAHQNAIWSRQRQLNALRSAMSNAGPKRSEQLGTPEVIESAHGLITRSAMVLITTFNAQIAELEAALSEHFEQHPDAKVVLSLPGLGTVLGARVLGEFGDDRTRFSDPKSRKNYAGTSPVTKASGHSRVVLARFARNKRLGDACEQWAFCALSTSAGARNYYDQLRARGKTHRQALRQLANRLVGILHVCLARGVLYDELVAWPIESERAA
jgi:transposase